MQGKYLENELVFRLVLVFAVLLIAANTFDAATTYFALQKGRNYESNASMAFLLDNFGFLGYVIKLMFAWLVLPVKGCMMGYMLKEIEKVKNMAMRNSFAALVIVVYLLLTFIFLKVGIANMAYAL